jgi:ADP-ribosylglycohydrolase
MENRLHRKILGCLGAVAIGDALGMPCHDMTSDEIRRRFGGRVRAFHPPFGDTRVHGGLGAARVTDDTLLTLAVADAYLQNDGRITSAAVAAGLLQSYQRARDAGCGTMFGPSTRRAAEAIAAGRDPVQTGLTGKHPMACASNGAAMKIAPAGLVHPADPDAAIADAVTISLVSHGTQTAIAAACAVAAGVAEAMAEGADVFSVVRAALYGAREGERIGRQRARTVPLPSVARRIELAVGLALKAEDAAAAGRSLADMIGTGLAAYESIPTAIGLFVAAAGDPLESVIGGANVGYDTDTIAAMAGALAGALKGFEAVPADLFAQVGQANDLGLDAVAQGLAHIARRNRDAGRRPS